MKYRILLLLCCITFLSCEHSKKNVISKNISKTIVEKDTLVYLKKLSITGDFNGDGKLDTINQNVINEMTHELINSFPNSVNEESMQRYFDKMNADIILTMKNRKCDTLHLGSGSGLYCLINLGDNNKDRKDEIAFVADYHSISNISQCTIYTICNTKWTELKSFDIFESAFDYTDENIPEFKQIKGFLEHRKNKWYYIDYMDWWAAKSDKDTILKPLKIKKSCS